MEVKEQGVKKSQKLEVIRGDLERRRETLMAQINEREKKMQLDVDNPDRSELAQSFTAMQEGVLFVEKANKWLAEIEAALGRLDAGTYGLCVNCGKEISADRLEALPGTSMCIQCKTRQERRY